MGMADLARSQWRKLYKVFFCKLLPTLSSRNHWTLNIGNTMQPADYWSTCLSNSLQNKYWKLGALEHLSCCCFFYFIIMEAWLWIVTLVHIDISAFSLSCTICLYCSVVPRGHLWVELSYSRPFCYVAWTID